MKIFLIIVLISLCYSCYPRVQFSDPTINVSIPSTSPSTSVSTSTNNRIPLSTAAGTKAGNDARKGLLWGSAGLGVLAVACLVVGLWLQMRIFLICAAGCMFASIVFVGLAVYLEWLLLGILAIIIFSFIIVGIVLFRTARNIVLALEKAKTPCTDGIPMIKFDNPNLNTMGSLAKSFVDSVQKKVKTPKTK